MLSCGAERRGLLRDYKYLASLSLEDDGSRANTFVGHFGWEWTLLVSPLSGACFCIAGWSRKEEVGSGGEEECYGGLATTGDGDEMVCCLYRWDGVGMVARGCVGVGQEGQR